MLKRNDDGKPHVIAEDGRCFRVGRRRGKVVEGYRIDELGQTSSTSIPAQVIESKGRRDSK